MVYGPGSSYRTGCRVTGSCLSPLLPTCYHPHVPESPGPTGLQNLLGSQGRGLGEPGASGSHHRSLQGALLQAGPSQVAEWGQCAPQGKGQDLGSLGVEGDSVLAVSGPELV